MTSVSISHPAPTFARRPAPNTRRRNRATAALFDRIESTTDPEERRRLRAEVAQLHLDVADRLAAKYRGRGQADDDLRQAANVGLMKAVHGYNAGRGTDFLSYAIPTMSGELKKYFRDYCWTVKPTRRVQELQHQVWQARETLRQELGAEPTFHEIAAELGVPVSAVGEAMNAYGCYTPQSLDGAIDEAGETALSSMLGDRDPAFGRAEAHAVLTSAVRRLSERDRRIIALRFYHDLTQREIAEEIGVTQMQVSRLLTRILLRLRDSLRS